MRCTLCGRDLTECDVFYTPRNPTGHELQVFEQLFDVDIFEDFDVCRECVNDTPFHEWLRERAGHPRRPTENESASEDWQQEGF